MRRKSLLTKLVRQEPDRASGTQRQNGGSVAESAMPADWSLMSDELQLVVSREALLRASTIVAEQAELLAAEIEIGRLADRGGADALRLLAAIVRLNNDASTQLPAGHA